MAGIAQFVSAISASPTVRLDLNSTSSNLMVDEKGIDLSPPVLRYAVASTMLQDGETIAGSSYENRVLKLPLKLVYAASTDAAATALQNLGRELNRPTNIIKLQLDGATSPVFFRTFRSSYALSMLRLLLTENTTITLELPTEYAGYGLLETPVSSVTVNADPAAGSNGCFVDVTGVKGDVEAPALIRWPHSAIAENRQSVFAVRRRGTPSATPLLFQVEAMTQSTDTTIQANDANFSGAGSNYSRTTFATNATMVTRAFLSDIGTPSVDLRGRYRAFLRYRKNTASDGINIRLLWGEGNTSVTNDTFATPNFTTLTFADLGLVSIPHGRDPVQDFRSGTELVIDDDFWLILQAQRTSGSGTLDLDCLLLVPADDRLAVVKWPVPGSNADRWWLDALDTSAHPRNSSDQVVSLAAPEITGGFPMLSPGETNRIFALYEVGAGRAHAIATTTVVSVSYYPLYLSVRPAST